MSSRYCLLMFLLCGIGNAQRTPVFSEYNYNPFIINSAYAGAIEKAEFSFSNTGFFSTIKGSPKNFAASFRTALRNKTMGLGGAVIRDEIGVTTSTSVFAAYSYRIALNIDNQPYWKVGEASGISFGLTIGLQKYNENLLSLGIENDPLLAQNIDATLPIVGAGIVLNYSKFFVGLSTPNLLRNTFASKENLNLETPYYGYMGYFFYLNSFADIMLKPNFLFKYEKGAPIQADLNLSVTYNSKLEFGFGYRTNSSLNLLLGLYIFDSLRIVYSYNLAGKELTIGNTHGISLNYRLGRGFEKN